jgi:hypothetical protein
VPNPPPIDDPRPPKPREVLHSAAEITRLMRLEEVREIARQMRLTAARH